MKRVLVHLRDPNNPIAASEWMEDAEAEATKARIEAEHAKAAGENRWIQVGGDVSVQSVDIVLLRLEEETQGASAYFGEDDGPRVRRSDRF